MTKNITISVTDELAKKMDKFKEVNWSEVGRKGIERYIDERTKHEEKGE